ncbi:MAG: hypothetical protein VB934_03815, partial [Polyangiaceae bacterium]
VGSSVTADGFFSMRSFAGQLIAGQFGYGHEAESMVMTFPSGQPAAPGLQGISESVCALREHGGYLYANTESDGDIFRSTNGASWTRVYDGAAGVIGCGLASSGSFLYAVQYDFQNHRNGQVLRSDNGVDWDVVWDSGDQSIYLREIVVHEGTVHAFGVDENSEQGYRVSAAENDAQFEMTETPSRFFRALSQDGALWVGSTSRSSNGEAGIWRFDGAEPQLVHGVDSAYVTELASHDGALWAGTSAGWKDDTGDSQLIASADGTEWKTICEFDELASWALATHNGALYVGTWAYGSGGHVYRVDPVDVTDPPEPVDCGLISANPAWEVCETSDTSCAGVFNDGAGCNAYCAAAGLECAGRFGGEPGCMKEPENVLGCDDNNGHQSDWCECVAPDGPVDPPDPPDCDEDSRNPAVYAEQGYMSAVYTKRHNWALTCYPNYGYTAGSSEHQACDSQYQPDGSRTGTATHTFSNVPAGRYDVFVGGRHTENRNPAGALFIVDGHNALIDQRDDANYVWDLHGQYCLVGDVKVTLDSSVNNGSDSLMGVRLVPAN